MWTRLMITELLKQVPQTVYEQKIVEMKRELVSEVRSVVQRMAPLKSVNWSSQHKDQGSSQER